MPSIEDSLGGAIGEAIAVATDKQVMTGDGSGADLTGLFDIATDVAIDGTAETYASGVARFAALVDGRYAHSMADLRAVIGTDTYAAYAALFRNGSDGNLFDYLMVKLGGLFVSTHVPSKSGMGQKGIVTRTRGSQIAEVPVWSGLTLIRDQYTDAAKGQITVTAHALVGNPAPAVRRQFGGRDPPEAPRNADQASGRPSGGRQKPVHRTGTRPDRRGDRFHFDLGRAHRGDPRAGRAFPRAVG